jgi:hypothetical protein
LYIKIDKKYRQKKDKIKELLTYIQFFIFIINCEKMNNVNITKIFL